MVDHRDHGVDHLRRAVLPRPLASFSHAGQIQTCAVVFWTENSRLTIRLLRGHAVAHQAHLIERRTVRTLARSAAHKAVAPIRNQVRCIA